ncbi:MAG: AIR synthase-related protein, partial [Desulfocucumaceae bacterium]
IKGMAHITGGGLTENIPRILPAGTSVVIERNSWHSPPVFSLIQKAGSIEDSEMLKTFNMGIGLVMVAGKNDVDGILENIRDRGEKALIIGEVTASPDRCVTYR